MMDLLDFVKYSTQIQYIKKVTISLHGDEFHVQPKPFYSGESAGMLGRGTR